MNMDEIQARHLHDNEKSYAYRGHLWSSRERQTHQDRAWLLKHIDHINSRWGEVYEVQTKRIAELEAKYNELLYAVHCKYPGESRHDTALRYIRDCELLTGRNSEAAGKVVSDD